MRATASAGEREAGGGGGAAPAPRAAHDDDDDDGKAAGGGSPGSSGSGGGGGGGSLLSRVGGAVAGAVRRARGARRSLHGVLPRGSCRALAACLVAAAVGAYAYFGHRTTVNGVRLALGRTGLGGWCDPHPVPRARRSYAGPESGASASWPGDAAFFDKLPCARDEYRVVQPGPAADDAAVPDACASLIVTAMFEIGRASWATYARSNALYRQKAATVLSLTNPMVIFTGPGFADDFLGARRAAGLGGRTLVVETDVHCVPPAWLLKPVSKVMCSPEYAYGAAYPEVPERQQPWYNLLMFAKPALLEAAAALPHAGLARGYVTWLDLGCHDPMCDEAMGGRCFDPPAGAARDRVRIAQTAPVPPGVIEAGPVPFFKAHRVHFAGTVFGTGRANAGALAAAFRDTTLWLLGQGVVCYDQTVFFWAWARAPHLFEAYAVFFDEWADIARDFAGGAMAGGAGEAKAADDEARRRAARAAAGAPAAAPAGGRAAVGAGAGAAGAGAGAGAAAAATAAAAAAQAATAAAAQAAAAAAAQAATKAAAQAAAAAPPAPRLVP